MTASRLASVAMILLVTSVPARAQIDVGAALSAFERGTWTDGAAPALDPDALVANSKALKATAPYWITAATEDQRPRRRLVVATFVLQVLRSQDDPYLWQGGGAPFRYRAPLPAVDLLEWACGVLREQPPLAAERWWHVGALALLERHNAQQALRLHLDHAHSRFPSEDRWTLGRALVEELRTWPQARDDEPFRVFPDLASSIIGRYEEAAARPSIRDEALIRFGYFELRRQRPEQALQIFGRAGPPSEPTLRYWLGLFRGQALESTDRLDEAIASYRAALADAPGAQSAVMALAAALTAKHADGEAAQLIAATLPALPAPDPWASYLFPDWRFWPRLDAELRRAVKP